MSKKSAARRPVPYFVDRRLERLQALKEEINAAWDSGKLHYPEKYPEVAKLKEEYDRIFKEVHGADVFDQIVAEADRDDRLMERVERFIERSPEHRSLLKGSTRDARAIELEQDPEVRAKVLKGLEQEEGVI